MEKAELLAQIVVKMSEKEQELVHALEAEKEKRLQDDPVEYKEIIRTQIEKFESSMAPNVLKPQIAAQWKQLKKNDGDMQRWITKRCKNAEDDCK